MSAFWKLLVYAIAAYIVFGMYIYFMQSRLIFYPDMLGRNLVATPESIGLAYQNIEFVTEDNIKLHGWFIPDKEAKATLLFFHGNVGNISHRLNLIKFFHQMELNVFIIDYRGYGKSEGKITEEGTYKDAEAAWTYLRQIQHIREKQIIIFGRSLGASIATWLASRHTPAALIIESGFSSAVSMGQRLYPFLPVRWLTQFKYNTLQYVKTVSCPVMVAHSRNDEIIPYDEGRKIFEAAPEPKKFFEMRGGHNDGFITSGTSYVKALKSFINKYL